MTPLERLLEVTTALKRAGEFHDSPVLTGTVNVLVRDIRAAVADLTPRYTAKVPTEPGWYWWKPSNTTPFSRLQDMKSSILLVEVMGDAEEGPGGGTLSTFCNDTFYEPERMGGLWSGPILKPEEGEV